MLVPRLSAVETAEAMVRALPSKLGGLSNSVQDPTWVALSFALARFPCTLRFRDGTTRSVQSRPELLEAVHRYRSWDRESTSRTYRIPSLGRSVEIETWQESTGTEVFLEEIYSKLPVEDRSVIDVGANIGDSPIYFALKGARRVLAFESDPTLCEVARRNLARNGIKNVDLTNAIVVGERDRVPRAAHGALRDLPDAFQGPVPNSQPERRSLSGILQGLEGDEVSLKLDCEGAEYEILLSLSQHDLRHVYDIQLEYHYGPRLLAKHLKSLGYQVLSSESKFDFIMRTRQTLVFGDLMARRN